MANINRVVLVGNLTKDPELRHTPNGTAVCKLRIAVNTRQKDAQGNWGDKPNYFDVTVWGNQGESCAQYLSKGRPAGAQASRTVLRPDPAEVLLLLQGQGRRDRLQERQPAAPVHLRAGQDPIPPDHGSVPPAPASGSGCSQAGPRDGAAAVRLGRKVDGSHPPERRRQGRSPRRGRERRARLRTELSVSARPRR